MISKGVRCLCILLFLHLSVGCSVSMPVEGPLCVPLRPVLESLSTEEQLRIRDAGGNDLLRRISVNDAKLKSHIRVLEGVIQAHDEPLGGCD